MTDDRHYNDAEELADRLDAALPPASSEQPPIQGEDDDVLVKIASVISAGAPPALSLDAMARIQSRMLAAQQQANSAPVSKVRRPRILNISQSLLAAVASVVLVLFFASPLISRAVPGDFLYPVKRGVERVELGLAGAVQDEAAIHVNRANRRIEELVSLAEDDAFKADLVENVVNELSAATSYLRENSLTPPPALLAQVEQVNALLDFSINTAARNSLASAEELGEVLALVGSARGSGVMLLGLDAEAAGQILLAAPEETPGTEQTPEATLEAEVTPESTPEIIVMDELTPEPELTPDAEIVVEAPQTQALSSAVIATIVGDGRVNVRRAPGLDAEIVTSLRPGALVQIIGSSDDGEWRRVRLPDSTEGWVANILLAVGQVGLTDPLTGMTTGSSGVDTSDNANTGTQGDFGCDEPGNACNAPGQSNGSANGQQNGNGSGQSGGRP